MTHFFENILEFVRQTSIIMTVCLRFYRQSDVTLLKEFQQCLKSRYLAFTSFSRHTLVVTLAVPLSCSPSSLSYESMTCVSPVVPMRDCLEVTLCTSSAISIAMRVQVAGVESILLSPCASVWANSFARVPHFP